MRKVYQEIEGPNKARIGQDVWNKGSLAKKTKIPNSIKEAKTG